jgi:hypothetical protein
MRPLSPISDHDLKFADNSTGLTLSVVDYRDTSPETQGYRI